MPRLRARRSFATVLVVAAMALVRAAPAIGQDSNFALRASAETPRANGWTLTPSLLYQVGWDDNALLRANRDEPRQDILNVVNPRGEISYLGARGLFEADYDGSFLLYRQLNSLNSYDQHGAIGARRLIKTADHPEPGPHHSHSAST